MTKITVSISALLLAAGLMGGCGEKEEPKKAEGAAATATSKAAETTANKAEQTGAGIAAGVGAVVEKAGEAAGAAVDATKSAAGAVADAAKPAADAAKPAVDAAKPAVDGEKVYKGLCFSCHDAGVVGAPKLGDKAAWAPRIAAGMDSLYNNSLKGKGAMPAKGGNPKLSDEEVKAAVDWMVAKAK